MIFYQAVIKYEPKDDEAIGFGERLMGDACGERKNTWNEILRIMNQKFGMGFGPKKALSGLVYDGRNGQLEMALALKAEETGSDEATGYLKEFFENTYAVEHVRVEGFHEVEVDEFRSLGDRADFGGYIRGWRGLAMELGIGFFDNSQFSVKEMMCGEETLTEEEAREAAGRILADQSFLDEIGRIYSADNAREYYGNPVHYKINAGNLDSAETMTILLAQMLLSNNRLLGRRISVISNIREGCYDEIDLENVFRLGAGGVVVIDMSGSKEEHGPYASAYQEVMMYFGRMIAKYQFNTLFVFAEMSEQPGFAGTLISMVQEDISLVEISEGKGQQEDILNYMVRKAEEKGLKVSRESLKEQLAKSNNYTIAEAHNILDSVLRKDLRLSIYPAYRNCEMLEVADEKKSDEPYTELQKMVGLTEIKRIIDDLIDSEAINAMRRKMGLEENRKSLHMVFTGSPGSAKTSVARLLAQILYNEGIIECGKIVECGRADLVGKYVGWTAKTVRAKFRAARGGILFIDEAYSLVSDDSFGSEAINTIVQEMENNRDSVVVILAGYPDKMNELLDTNEGLRSRITFHLNFPDYNADELDEILKLMAANRKYTLDEKAIAACHDIFKAASKEREFGNGRFVRNLLEQAIMAQSRRLMRRDEKGRRVKPTRKMLMTLTAEDFESSLLAEEMGSAPGSGFLRSKNSKFIRIGGFEAI